MRKLVLLLICIIAMFISCVKENISIENISKQELRQEILSDPDFIELNKINAIYSSKLFDQLEKNLISSDLTIKASSSLDEMFRELPILKDYSNYLESVEVHSKRIRQKFPELAQLSKEELHSLLSEFPTRIEDYSASTKSKTDCDAQFQADMDAIHLAYDTSVALCTIAAISTGGAAIPCYAAAVGRAVLESAAAIDRHTLCVRNQQN